MKELELRVQQKFVGIHISSRAIIVAYGLALFLIPLLLSGPQIVVGSIVNALLIMAAIRYKNYQTMIPLVMIPSIAAVIHGVMFGPFSIFLVYMMPAIWIGNFLLVYTIQQSKQFISGMLTGGLYKAVFLAIVSYLLIYFGILPAIFLKAMGLIQLITVLIAGLSIWLIQKIYAKPSHN